MIPIAPIFARRRTAQRGMVTIVVMLFLIATVVFALAQMLNVSGANVVDSQRDGDSTAAFFLAESGVENVQARVAAAVIDGTYTNATCTGSPTYSLGRGSVTTTAVSTPPTCTISTCGACKVTSVGTVGISQRTVTQNLVLSTTNGVYCTNNCDNKPKTWQLNLKNYSGISGVGVFDLAYVAQGGNTASCDGGSNCVLQLQLDTGNGAKATAMQGNAVIIGPGNTYPIYQTMKHDFALAEVGVLFLGTGADLTNPPNDKFNTGRASYWDPTNTTSTGSPAGGSTNDGTWLPSLSCSSGPSASSPQSCTNWCYGGDTLAATFTADVSHMGDQITDRRFIFGTDPGGQNIGMTRVVKYPTSTDPNAPAQVDAEIWYASNPNFSGTSPLADHVSSYKALGSGAIGAKWTSTSNGDTSINVTTLTVGSNFNSVTPYPKQMINVGVGDVVSSTGGGASGDVNCTGGCPTIVAQLTSNETGGMATGRGGRGTYQLSKSATLAGSKDRVWTVSSNVLRTTLCWLCNFAAGDPLAGLITGRTIQSQAGASNIYGLTEASGGVGRYTISGAATQATWGDVAAGTPNGGTLYLPAGSSQPVLTDPAMLVTVKTATPTGTLAARTTVRSVDTPLNGTTNVFTVSQPPSAWLINASVCGGTCAFFNPGSDARTSFTIEKTGTINGWAMGFTCMKGIERVPQVVITDASVLNRRWTEPVQ